jgi:hypothetical protein
MEDKLIRFGIMIVTVLVVFVPLLWMLNRRGLLDWAKQGYAGTDRVVDDKEMGTAVSHVIQLVGLCVLIVMIITSFVFSYDFHEWKWIIFLIVVGAQMENISSWLPGIIQAFKKTKIG